MPIVFVAFAVFFGCCVAQFFLGRRVRQALAARHPDVWRQMSGRSLFVDTAVQSFAWRRGDQGLNDPDLTARTRQLQALHIVALFAWVVLFGLLLTHHNVAGH